MRWMRMVRDFGFLISSPVPDAQCSLLPMGLGRIHAGDGAC